MNDNSLISVAVTTYNGSEFLREQLDSIYNQSYSNIEVIVTDDRSNDSTIKILDEYHQKYGLMYIVNKTNLGFSKNFEKAISLCSGDFIALADQDDIWKEDKLEKLITHIGNYSLIYSDAVLTNEKNEVIHTSFKNKCNDIAGDNCCFCDFIFKKNIYGCTMMFTKQLAQQALPIPSECFQHDWWLPVVAHKMNGIKYLDKPLMSYRQHESSNIGAKVSQGKAARIYNYILCPDHRHNRNQRRQKRYQLLKDLLDTDINLSAEELEIITSALNYYEYFLYPQRTDLNFCKLVNNLKKYIYEKDYFLFMDILGHAICKS